MPENAYCQNYTDILQYWLFDIPNGSESNINDGIGFQIQPFLT